ncbi:MAG TPA: flagellar basal body P-ring protein FlgI [Gemmatimonadaceae bacterium]|nr:flagellar basal body P-ring protein FlgI [Gemmatimonadaceae bacterium]
MTLGRRISFARTIAAAVGLAVAGLAGETLSAQQMVQVRDLTISDQAVPLRLMGYGLVVGLDNTGDRAVGSAEGGMTVNSIVNLLRSFDIQVPPDVMRTRNVAAVVVTADVSPYLHPGGSFEVHVSSLGDASSLRGGVLFMTPLSYEVGGHPVASAQGAVITSDLSNERGSMQRVNSARIPSGGLLQADLPHEQFSQSSHLFLRDPDVTMASRIADAVNKVIGDGVAKVEDPGSIALTLKTDAKDNTQAAIMAKILAIVVQPAHDARLIIDARDGTIVAGGDLPVGEATVSHGGITLTIGAADTTAVPAGEVRIASGTQVTRVAAALHAIQAPPVEIAAIFEALRSAGAISGEVIIR